MKMYQVYVCEKCGHTSISQDEIELCEARNMGLQTIAEKHTYEALKSAATYFGAVLYGQNNERTRAAYDDAIGKLVAFEKEHGMS